MLMKELIEKLKNDLECAVALGGSVHYEEEAMKKIEELKKYLIWIGMINE